MIIFFDVLIGFCTKSFSNKEADDDEDDDDDDDE